MTIFSRARLLSFGPIKIVLVSTAATGAAMMISGLERAVRQAATFTVLISVLGLGVLSAIAPAIGSDNWASPAGQNVRF
jgi:hypothetical protein